MSDNQKFNNKHIKKISSIQEIEILNTIPTTHETMNEMHEITPQLNTNVIDNSNIIDNTNNNNITHSRKNSSLSFTKKKNSNEHMMIDTNLIPNENIKINGPYETVKHNFFTGICLIILTIVIISIYYMSIDQNIIKISSSFSSISGTVNKLDIPSFNIAIKTIPDLANSIRKLNTIIESNLLIFNSTLSQINNISGSIYSLSKFSEIDIVALNESIKKFPILVDILINITKK